MRFSAKFLLAFLLSVSCCAIPFVQNKERTEYKQIRDLDGSASSYFFRQDHNGPMQVVYLTSDVPSSTRRSHYEIIQPHPKLHHRHIHKKPLAPLKYYRTHNGAISSYTPAYNKIYYQNHQQHPQPIYSSRIKYVPGIVEDVSKQYHRETQGEEDDDNSGNASHQHDHAHRKRPQSDSDSSSSSSESKSKEGGSSSGKSAHSGEGNHDHKGAKEHNQSYNKKNGKKSTSSYEKSYKYSKGRKGKHKKDDHKGKKEEEGKHDSAKYDESHKYHEHDEKGKHKKGGSFGSKKHHKKGTKSKGYHNVFMKDEYKKDHTFYDVADHEGQFKKYGAEDKKFKNFNSKGEKGHHHESASKEKHKKAKGKLHEGHHDHDDKGYKKESGHQEKHSDHHKYAKKDGKEYKEQHADNKDNSGAHDEPIPMIAVAADREDENADELVHVAPEEQDSPVAEEAVETVENHDEPAEVPDSKEAPSEDTPTIVAAEESSDNNKSQSE